MVLGAFTENKDVIDIHHDADVKSSPEDALHLALKSCRRVGDAEGHHRPLARPIRCRESQVRTALGSQRDLIISLRQIQLGEKLSAVQLSEHCLRQRQRVGVFSHQRIHPAIVDTKSRLTGRFAVLVLLDYHQQLTAPLAVAFFDNTDGLAFLDHLALQAEFFGAFPSLPIPHRLCTLLS